MRTDDNFPKILRNWQIENVVGKVMLVVESLGLNENQLEASKSLIKQFIWFEFNEGIWLTPEGEEANRKELEKQGVVNVTL